MKRRNILLVFALAAAPVAWAQSRVVALEGSRNFRDLGGYSTYDGRTVKWGRIYRSDALARLTTADFEKLAALKIGAVCDLRTSFERDREPTKWQGAAMPEFLLLDMSGGAGKGEDPAKSFMRPLLEAKGNPAAAADLMANGMRRMALEEGAQIGKVFRRALDSDRPILFHCSAGKDRTGITAAFLLKTLGVKDDLIYEDYLLVNQLMPPERTAAAMAERVAKMTGMTIDAAMLKPLMGTQREWLEGAFLAVNEKYGSFEAYRREVLGVSDAQAAALRAKLLD